jgi:hypothetical protein
MGTIRHARYLRELAEHVLNVDPNAKPVKHKLAVSRTQSVRPSARKLIGSAKPASFGRSKKPYG